VATGFFCSLAKRYVFIAPPFTDDWLIRTPFANAAISLLRFRKVRLDADMPKANSLINTDLSYLIIIAKVVCSREGMAYLIRTA